MSYPLGSCTWVPADSYNYIDIYAAQNNTHGETPGRVLESDKLLKQKKVLLNANKIKKKKRKTNKYDELSVQYQYAQKWLNKRNSQVSVKLTRTELKVFIKWFDSRMNLFQKADGIDVDKVGEEFVKHKIFHNQAEALSFLDKVDLDGNGALSYEEFCKGMESVNDYLQVMLLKKFIHSLKEKEYKNRMKNFKDSDKFSKSERLLKKDKVTAADTVVPKKAVSGGDIALAATITKVPISGGAYMYIHSPAKKRVEVSASSSLPAAGKKSLSSPGKRISSSKAGSSSNTNTNSNTISSKNNANNGSNAGKNTLPMVGGTDDLPGGHKNNINNSASNSGSYQKMSLFIAPGSDAILHQHTLFKQAARQQQQEQHDKDNGIDKEADPPAACESSSSSPRQNCKSSKDDILRIKTTMQGKLAHFLSHRQLSFEEKENVKGNEEDFEVPLDDASVGFEDLEMDTDNTNTSTNRRESSANSGFKNKPILAWTTESNSPPASAGGKSRFRNKLVSAIERHNDLGEIQPGRAGGHVCINASE